MGLSLGVITPALHLHPVYSIGSAHVVKRRNRTQLSIRSASTQQRFFEVSGGHTCTAETGEKTHRPLLCYEVR